MPMCIHRCVHSPDMSDLYSSMGALYHESITWFSPIPTDIDEDFKKELINLVPLLLAPDNLVEKEISGSKVTCRDLVQYFKVSSFFRCLCFRSSFALSLS